MVSHDRYFLDRIVNRIFSLKEMEKYDSLKVVIQII